METHAPRTVSDLPVFDERGGIRAFSTERLRVMTDFIQRREPVLRVRGLAGVVVLAHSPDVVHEVLVEKARSFEKSPVLRSALHPLVGEGLFTSEGELWKRQRKLMSPIFQVSQIEGFAAAMGECAVRTAETFKDGATVDIARETTRIAMAVAGKTLFDIDTFGDSDEIGNALTVALHWTGEQASGIPLLVQARLRTLIMRLADRAPPPLEGKLHDLSAAMIRPVLLPGKKTRELKAALALLEARVTRMIEDRRRNPGREDLLSRLLAARDDDGGGRMTDRQVRDEVLTLFVAGHETTATALAWAIMLLCQNPQAYARARDEALALGGVPGHADLPLLSYCLRVFKESMRLYPPVFIFGRQAITDVEIGGYLLPRGTICIVAPYTMHRRPDLWPDPDRFDPDRFLPDAEAARPKAAYFPFSLGPRTCIGNHFALMEGPIVLATLLRHADFELLDPRGTEPDPQATLRPKGGLPVRVRIRNALSSSALNERSAA
jgi:cytochrome P450